MDTGDLEGGAAAEARLTGSQKHSQSQINLRRAALDEYRRWVEGGPHAPEIEADLNAVTGDPDAVFERFYRHLAFGTGGLRGPLGAGTNRLNRYTVRRVSAGLAAYVKDMNEATASGSMPSVVIGYDCRRMSPDFALETALTFAAAGIRTFVFSRLCPTPELSFAVRAQGAQAGVMITASHNPPQDNGYKVYGPDGGQLLPDAADAVTARIDNAGDLLSIPVADREAAEASGLLRFIGGDIDDAYRDAVLAHIAVPDVGHDARADLSVVYTPLHGTGNRPVQDVLRSAGFLKLQVVPTQEQPDSEFRTVKSPNPEEPEALAAGVELAREHEADLVMGTDPDADRVGIAVRTAKGQYRLLTGNQVGGLLVDFWLRTLQRQDRMPDNGVVFKTIVTSDLGAAVAREYGVEVEETLTGFKYIGAQATRYEQTGERRFVFGYEESYGYLAAPIVRDKDAVQSCLLIALMAAEAKRAGKTLIDELEVLYTRVGWFAERLQSVTLPGANGVREMQALMERLRVNGVSVPGAQLAVVEDYAAGTQTLSDGTVRTLALPTSDVLKYMFDDGSWLAVRPSGTEPKLKIYYGAKGESSVACNTTLDSMQRAVALHLRPSNS